MAGAVEIYCAITSTSTWLDGIPFAITSNSHLPTGTEYAISKLAEDYISP
jgi:hypothetical protein